MRALSPRQRRGQAITEFALVVPVMIVIFLYSMYFTELVRAKLKMQEASRYVAWEMTSYDLDDYANANHTSAFSAAQSASITDALDKFKDLDSIEDRPPVNFVVGYQNFTATVRNLDAPVFPQKGPQTEPNGFIDKIISVMNGGATATYGAFKLNTKGRVEVEVKMNLDNRLLPQHFLDGSGGFFQTDVWGGRNLQSLALKNRFTLLASGWQLPDGADADQHQDGAGGPRAGVHRGGSQSGLYTQVHRMHLLGLPALLQGFPVFKDVTGFIGRLVPDPINATYVVSKNYFVAGDANIADHGCDQDPSHGAVWGMNNLEVETGNDGPGMDNREDTPGSARRKCYDTAPFRDTSDYKDSLYRQIYQARGGWFMGCKQAQADNPSEAGDPEYIGKDLHARKAKCEQ